MGAAESTPAEGSGPAGQKPESKADQPDDKGAAGQFVLVVTAPPGVGKETLMGEFIGQKVGKIAYVARAGAVSANEPGLVYPYTAETPPTTGSHPSILHATHAALRDGKSAVLDADTATAVALRRAGLPATFVFILPADSAALRHNLHVAYGGDDADAAAVAATVAFAEREMAILEQDDSVYDFTVVNKGDDAALASLAGCLKDAYTAEQVLRMPLPQTAPAREAAAGASGSHAALPPLPPQPAATSSAASPRGPAAAPAQSSAADMVAASTPDWERASRHADPDPDGANVAIPPGMERWRDRVAIVTGASSGIGWALAQVLVRAGLRVTAAARRKHRLEELQAQVLAGGASRRSLLPIVCDVAKDAEARSLVALTQQTFGEAPAIIVNCAGLARADGSLMDGDSAAWVEMLSTNVLAAAMVGREGCRAMRAAGAWGHIVNVSSMSGHRIPAGIGAGGFYAATKHALRALTEGLRQEARAAGVPLRVSLVSPGVVHTEFFSAMSGGDDATVRQYLDRPGLTAGDVAGAVLFALAAPPHMEVDDVMVRPTHQVV